MRPGEQGADVAQAAMFDRFGKVGVDRVDDQRPLLRLERPVLRIDQALQPLGQEGAIFGRVRKVQRIEAARRAWTQDVIAPADGADEDLGPAVLVEVDDARPQAARLGDQEAEEDGPCPSRRTS